MFSYSERMLGAYREIVLEGPGCEVSMLPEFGAAIHRLKLSGVEILRKDAETEIARNPRFRGRFLFPWNDRIAKARFRFRGREYRLAPNSEDGSAIHGFLYRNPARIVRGRANEDHASLSAEYATSREPGYPFSCRLGISIELRLDSLFLSFELANDGERSAPVAFGWHPYFDLGCPTDDLYLRVGSEAIFPVDEALIPSGHLCPVKDTEYDFQNPRRIGSQDLDIAFRIDSSRYTACVVSGASGKMTMECDPGFFRCVQVYIPPERDSIAVEPVTSAADSFNREESGYIVLDPGERRSAWTIVRFEPTRRGD